MLKITLSILFLLALLVPAIAQETFYSYSDDRRFFDPTHLEGYRFVPGYLEIPERGTKRKLSPGAYSFGITQNNLYVDGGQIKGVYNINQINTTEFGYQLLLLNARDPSKQGHLKIILNPEREVDALIFRRDQTEDEMIFFIPLLDQALAARESAWFTEVDELVISHQDSVWGKRIYPFFRKSGNPRIQERLQIRDSTWLEFREEIEISEKKSKKKKDKVEKKDTTITPSAPDSVSLSRSDSVRLFPNHYKVEKRYYLTVHTLLYQSDDSRERKVEEHEIKRIKEREDEQAQGLQERFMWEIETEKGNTFFLYLTAMRTVSSFEYGDILYTLRGY